MEINITEAEKSDVEEIIKIASESNLSYWSPEDYYEEIERSDSLLLIAKQKKQVGEIVGFLIARLIILKDNPATTEPNFAEVYNIGVTKSKRNKKIGEKLLLELFDRCSKANVREIWLEVRISNAAAIAFYKKMNFVIVHQRKNFYANPSEDALIMKSELSYEKP